GATLDVPASLVGGLGVRAVLDRHRRRALIETNPVDQQVLHHALDVVARLGKRDALDPVDGVDLRDARVAVLGDPLLDAPPAGVVSHEAHHVIATVVPHEPPQLTRTPLTLVY